MKNIIIFLLIARNLKIMNGAVADLATRLSALKYIRLILVLKLYD